MFSAGEFFGYFFFVSTIRLRCRVSQFAVSAVAVGVLAIDSAGAPGFGQSPPAQYVYVTAKQTFLRDRVAAVSNRTGTVENGDKLEVLERGRRFVRVQTAKGEQGWIDEKAVATQEIFDQFEALKQQHKDDPTVASAVVRDEVYLHSSSGTRHRAVLPARRRREAETAVARDSAEASAAGHAEP